MRLINLTPHPLSIRLGNGVTRLFPASGTVARVAVTRRPAGQLRVEGASLDVHVVEYGDVEGLPEPELDTIYVVSALVASRAPRPDVYAPGELVRDEAGRVVGCRGLTASVDCPGPTWGLLLGDTTPEEIQDAADQRGVVWGAELVRRIQLALEARGEPVSHAAAWAGTVCAELHARQAAEDRAASRRRWSGFAWSRSREGQKKR